MTLKLLHLKDTFAFGKLIEEFAKNNSWPDTVDELNGLLLARGITAPPDADGNEAHWPNGKPSGKIKYADVPSEDFMMTKIDINDIEEGFELTQQLAITGDYPFPEGYNKNYLNDSRVADFSGMEDDWEHIYFTRLGDYTTGKCK